MEREKLLSTYKNALALRESITSSVSSEDNVAGKYASYPVFLRKFQEIRNLLDSHIDLSIVDSFDINKIPNPFNQIWPQQKQIFDQVSFNLSLLISRMEIELDIKTDQIKALKYFFESNTRKAVHTSPTCERDIQNIIETLLIGKGYEKGVDYDREVGRVKVSLKEVVPDFIVLNLSLAIEVKLTKDKIKSKTIVDEINADIQSYSKRYRYLLFIVYDMGSIRDTDEFKNGIVSEENGIYIVIIKH